MLSLCDTNKNLNFLRGPNGKIYFAQKFQLQCPDYGIFLEYPDFNLINFHWFL